jgi:putative ABC transport system permease protein
MLFTETLRVALDALRANKLRSLLTMLGIVIGIGSVITMVALGNGAQLAIQERIARLGTTVLQINPQRVQQGGIATTTISHLTVKDVNMIRERAPHVADVNWQQDRNLQVVWRNQNTNVQITGTPLNFLEVRGFHMQAGRMFTAAEDAGRRKVAVLGSYVLDLLGVDNAEHMIGEQIRIAGTGFTVIGVMAEKGTTGFGDNDQQILIPFQTGRFLTFGSPYINDIWALASSEDSIPWAMAEIQSAIRRSHKLWFNRPDDFIIRNQSDLLNTMSETTQTFTLLLSGIAAVSLLVGGIGIMNILMQFLTEAITLCMIGGIIGILAGVGGASQFSRVMGWKTAIDLKSILIAFSFASATGVIFGVWPARTASRLDPIEALRYE